MEELQITAKEQLALRLACRHEYIFRARLSFNKLAPERRDAVGAELADVLLYLVQLATALGLDPIAAAQAKLKLNEEKYPVDRARGNSRKYDEL